MIIRYTIGSQTNNVVFPLPPDMDYPEVKTPKESIVESITGERQITNYAIITTLYQRFSMLPLDFVTGPLQDFFLSHGLTGRQFLYSTDADLATASFVSWELDKREFKPQKNEQTVDRYDIDFTLRRI